MSKITIDYSLLEQALDALERERPYLGPMPSKTSAAITALREALAQPQQKHVEIEAVYETIISWDEGGGKRSRRELARRIAAIYTSPPAREPLWRVRLSEVLGPNQPKRES